MTAAYRPLRFAALGDETIGVGTVSTDAGGVRESHPSPRHFTSWLTVLAPWLALHEAVRFRHQGATSVTIAAELDMLVESGSLCDENGPVDGVIISTGLHDCFAMTKGIAPLPEETVASFEAMAVKLLDQNMIPVFVVPPPCPDFKNGLFADRYIAIAATLRRLARQDRRIGLVDAARALVDKRAYGVEPDRNTWNDGSLTAHGAFKLASAAEDALRRQFGQWFPEHPIAAMRCSAAEALNPNARLGGHSGTISTDRATGLCPDHFSLLAANAEGLTITAGIFGAPLGTGGSSLRIGGYGSAEQGFVKLAQRLAGDDLRALSPSDILQASCIFSLAGPVENVVAPTLQLTPVWSTGYAELAGSGSDRRISDPYMGVLRTPPFTIPEPLVELNVSLSLYIPPGAERAVSALLDVMQIMIRKVTPKP